MNAIKIEWDVFNISLSYSSCADIVIGYQFNTAESTRNSPITPYVCFYNLLLKFHLWQIAVEIHAILFKFRVGSWLVGKQDAYRCLL